jgi:hypothetical protein
MAQSIILPDGPLFIVDRGWKTPAGDFEIQIVPFGGKKRPQPSRRSLTSGPAAGLVKEPATDDATSQRNSENPRPRQKHKASSTPIQSFPFVNVTGPFQDQDAEARRLVRSHAMKGSRRSQRPRRTPSQRSTAVTAESGRLSPTQGTKDPQVDAPISLKLGSPLPGSATSFYGIIPCCMKPHFYGLLSYCMWAREAQPAPTIPRTVGTVANYTQTWLELLTRYIHWNHTSHSTLSRLPGFHLLSLMNCSFTLLCSPPRRLFPLRVKSSNPPKPATS